MIVIYHNPRCTTSRNVLEAIRAAGHEPVIVEYLKDGWTRAHLLGLFAAAGVTPAEALRKREEAAAALAGADDEAIIGAMVESPVLVERPFVAAPGGVRLCRPAERLQEIL